MTTQKNVLTAKEAKAQFVKQCSLADSFYSMKKEVSSNRKLIQDSIDMEDKAIMSRLANEVIETARQRDDRFVIVIRTEKENAEKAYNAMRDSANAENIAYDNDVAAGIIKKS